jgi:hypothetical protein
MAAPLTRRSGCLIILVLVGADAPRGSRRLRGTLINATRGTRSLVEADRRLAAYNFSQVAKLTATDAVADDRFGMSVAIDGDTVVVGAPGCIDCDDKGSAYVFQLPDGGATYEQVAKLTAADAARGDEFGYSVAIDGYTVVVGTNCYCGGLRKGSAYVFHTTDGGATYDQMAKLTATDGALYDHFGYSVAIDGATIVVGTYFKGEAAYVFRTSDGGATYGQVAKLTAADGASYYSGYSVAIDGDTVVIAQSGAVYVFRTTDGGATYGQVAKLTAVDVGGFGRSVAIDGDTIVVGARYDDDAGHESGSAYVFRTLDGGATYDEVTKLTAADAAAGDRFGYSVAIDGNTIVVGAPDDSSRRAPGSAYVFLTTDGGATYDEVAKLTADDAAAGDYFGWSVAIEGGLGVVGVAAFYRAWDGYNAGSFSGSAYVFDVNVPTSQPSDSNDSGSLGGGDSKKQCRTAYGSTEAGFLWLFLVLSIFSCAFCCYGIVRDLDNFNEDTKNLWALNFCFLFVFFILVIVMAVILPETCTTTPSAPPSPPTPYPTASFAPTTAAPTTPSPSTPHPTLSFAPTITAAPTSSPTTAAPSSAPTAAPGTLGALIICSVAAAVTLIFAAYVSCIKVKVYGKNRDDAVSMTSLAVFGLAALDFYSDAYFAYSAFQSKQPIVSTLGKVMIGWLVVIIAVDGWLLVEVKREHQLATNENDRPFDEAHSGTFLIIFLLTCTSAELIAAFPWEDAKANGFPDGNVEFCGFWDNSVEKWAERAGWLEDFPQLALECAVFIIQGGADGQEELFFCTIITFLAMIVRCILRRVLPRERDN